MYKRIFAVKIFRQAHHWSDHLLSTLLIDFEVCDICHYGAGLLLEHPCNDRDLGILCSDSLQLG